MNSAASSSEADQTPESTAKAGGTDNSLSVRRRRLQSPAPRFFAIVPAAGRSRRMGTPKLLLPWRERPLITHVLDAWRASRVSRVIVIAHPEDRHLAEVCSASGTTVVVPEVPPAEMKDSIACGLAWIAAHEHPAATDAWVVAPADLPRLSAAEIDRVIEAYDPASPRVVVPAHAGRRGHPALFPWGLAAEVARLAPDEGLNALFDRHPICEIAAAPSAGDIDTPDDYRRLSEDQY